jgi:c-di-AMP phosphodiesterase-like protein
MDNKKFLGIFIPRAAFYLWIIMILAVVIAVMDWRVSIPVFLLLVFLIYYNFTSNYKRQKEVTKYIENLTLNIDIATKDTLHNLPMPLAVLETDGTIMWYNTSFKNMLDMENLLEKNISSLIEEIEPDELLNEGSAISKQLAINNRQYLMLGRLVDTGRKNDASAHILLLYFVDNTELFEIRSKYENEKACVGIIIIDNYEDLMQSMEDANRPQMLAEIEKYIIKWLTFTGGIIKKFERDKYIYIFEYQYLKELGEKKFEILDAVKEINLGNKIPVTLSIGFGINGETISENFSYANASIDIALGRGGDQVVVKNRDSFSFYGGKTRELEKRTRVKARVIAYALRELIDQAPNVIIMGHENPDIDSLGAALGIYRIVKSRGVTAHIVLKNSNSTVDNMMQKIEKSGEYDGVFVGRTEAVERISKRTLLIILDTHRKSFTEIPELLDYTDQVVVIDHHRRGADYIQDVVLTYQETYASSTCELVTEILQYVDEKLKLNSLEVEALYAGIVVDTKNFTFKTGVRTFEAASFLRRKGADTLAVKQMFQNDLVTYTNISAVVKAVEIVGNSVGVSECPSNIKNPQLIAAKSADEILNLSGITAAFVLCYVNSEVFISGRSLGDINVQFILEKLGGGGHLSVAGAQLKEISLEEAKEKLKYAIIEYMESLHNE